MHNGIRFEIVDHSESTLWRFSGTSLDYLEPHFHNDFELLLPFHGHGTIVVNNTPYNVFPGDLCLFNPGEVHEILTNGSYLSILCLQISPKFFRIATDNTTRIIFDKNYLRGNLTDENLDNISALIAEFGYHYCCNDPVTRDFVLPAILNLIICALITSVSNCRLSESEFEKISHQNSRILRAAAFVENNFKRKISLSDFAAQEGLSVGYLSTFFKKHFNQTFREYVTAIRFAYAKSLLIHSDMKIADISYESGFSDPRYLYNAFMRYENCSPNEYRAKLASHKTPSDDAGDLWPWPPGAIETPRLRRIVSRMRTPIETYLQSLLIRNEKQN